MSIQANTLTRWDCVRLIGEILVAIAAAAGVGIGIFSCIEAREARKISEKALSVSAMTYDRAAGKIFPVISVRGHTPALELGTLDQLAKANLGVYVKNIGDEPIDLVRVNLLTSSAWSSAEQLGGYSIYQPQNDEWQTYDRKLNAVLHTGQEIWVDLKKELAMRLQGIRYDPSKRVDLFVIFRVECLGRLVGQETPNASPALYSRMDNGKQLVTVQPVGSSLGAGWPSR
jgi:hypothetical protein